LYPFLFSLQFQFKIHIRPRLSNLD